ncbi:MAG: hypothetical protein ACT4OF_06590 [Caulobacteraceae bacterium]
MRRAFCALALFMAAPAWAQSASEPSAAPGSLALGLIAQSNADGVFEPLPAEQIIVVRHSRSGLVCRFDPTHANRLLLFPQAVRGEDVACDSEGEGQAIRLYATRYAFETTLEQQLQGAVLAVQQLHPDLRAYSPATEIAADALPPHRTAHFFFNGRNGARLYSRVSVAVVRGWVIKLRYTTVAPDADAAQRAEQASGMLWNATLSELTARRV